MVTSDMLVEISLIIVYIGTGLMILPMMIRFAERHQVTAENYKKDIIPIGMGLFVWVMLIVFLLYIKVFNSKIVIINELYYCFIIAISVITFVGWLDDTIGEKSVKGFTGHWRRLKQDNVITTGLLKAGSISLMALWLVLELELHFAVAFLKFLIIVLMTNTMNLLDLRPGRALKVFFILSLPLMFFPLVSEFLHYLMPIWISAALIFYKDLRSLIMLGDTGSNLLGFALGFSIVLTSPFWFQVTLLFICFGIHVIAAKSSLSKWIAHYKILRIIDRWGR